MAKILQISLLSICLTWCSFSFGISADERLVQAIMSENIVRIRVLLRQVDDINQVRHKGQDLVTFAIKNGKDESAEFLKSQGAKVQKTNSVKKKPKTVATKKPKINKEINWNTALSSIENIKNALRQGASPNAVFNGESVLHYAANRGRVGVAKELILNGANPNKLDKNKRSILHAFAQSPSRSGVELALEQGVKENLKDSKGHTYKTYLLASSQGQVIFNSLRLKNASEDEMTRATKLAANTKDIKALKNLLVVNNGKHDIDISSDLLTAENFEIALLLNRYASVRAKRFYRGKTFYQMVTKDFSVGYYLVTMGADPKPKSFLDVQRLAELCKTQDMMPMLAAGKIIADTPMTEFDHETLFDFMSTKCEAEQSLNITEIAAKNVVNSMVISNELALEMALGDQ